MYRKNRARYRMIPNATLGGDSDCTVLLTLDDIARCLTNESYVYIPKCLMQGGRGLYTDIAGVTLVEHVMKKTGVKARVLHRIRYRAGQQAALAERITEEPTWKITCGIR